MTEDDWDLLYRWNNDPEVLYYTEGEDVTERSLEDIQGIYQLLTAATRPAVLGVGFQIDQFLRIARPPVGHQISGFVHYLYLRAKSRQDGRLPLLSQYPGPK